jgi:hypothetical protein
MAQMLLCGLPMAGLSAGQIPGPGSYLNSHEQSEQYAMSFCLVWIDAAALAIDDYI